VKPRQYVEALLFLGSLVGVIVFDPAPDKAANRQSSNLRLGFEFVPLSIGTFNAPILHRIIGGGASGLDAASPASSLFYSH
jgi:hypothetical protein